MDRYSPSPVVGANDWLSVDAGGDHACGRRTDWHMYCWGRDSAGEVGDGDTQLDTSIPVRVLIEGTRWTSLSSGSAHTCARRARGRLYCWGWDRYGQIGDGGPYVNHLSPVAVAG